MGNSDITSSNIQKGDVNQNNNMIFLFILVCGGAYLLFRNKKKVRVRSGVSLINISISPHNEKIAVGMGIVALLMYGYHLYIERRSLEENHKK
jgi:hypothetical protein